MDRKILLTLFVTVVSAISITLLILKQVEWQAENFEGTITPVWLKTWGGVKEDRAWDVAVDGGYLYFTGVENLEHNVSGDLFLRKYDPNGNLIWSKMWDGGVSAGFVVIVSDGYVYVGGYTNPTLEYGNADALIQKYDLDENLIWSKTWGGSDYEELDGLAIQQGTIYASVWTGPILGDLDVALLRYDLDGNLLGSTVWEAGGKRNEPNGHIYSDSTGVYIAGGLYSGATALSGGDAYLAKFDLNGNYLWHKTWDHGDYDDALSLTSDGEHLYISGMSRSGGKFDAFVLKYTMDGNLVWDKTWGGPDDEVARGIAVDDAYVWVSASTKSYGSGGRDLAILKYKKDGTFLGYKLWGGSGDDMQHSLKADYSYLYLAGETGSLGADGPNVLLMKVEK